MRTRIVMGLVLLACIAALAGEAVAQPAITAGADGTATLTGAVRLRDLRNGAGGEKEIWIGVPPLVAGSVTQGDRTWATSNCVEFSVAGGSLTVKVANAATPCNFTGAVTVTRAIVTPVNYIEIALQRHNSSTSVGRA
jgi:hypothetical protein